VVIEVLYLEGCPNYEPLVSRLVWLLEATQISYTIESRPVADELAAQSERFLGSPTVRINGCDAEPGADKRTDFGLKCRLYRTGDAITGQPAEEWIAKRLANQGRVFSDANAHRA
jgi:hypothetical protein